MGATGWGGRPRGEIRQAVFQAAESLTHERGAFTGRDAAMAAQAGWEAARRTLQNMVTAGELVVVGTARAPGVSRPLNLYTRPAVPQRTAAECAANCAADLARAMHGWADFT